MPLIQLMINKLEMKIKLIVVHPRYSLEDDRPSQTTNDSYLISKLLFWY